MLSWKRPRFRRGGNRENRLPPSFRYMATET
jgi:hypothetical protein